MKQFLNDRNDANLKIMTFNIRHGKGTDRQFDLQRIADVLAESEADLIGLNEVDRHFSKRSSFMDQINFLAQYLGMHEAFGAALTLRTKRPTGLREYGNAFLSRYPIISHENHAMNFYPGMIEGRALLEVNLNINDQSVKVYVTHLSLNPIFHKKQTDFILKKVMADHQPVILMGDWNMRTGSQAWRKITRHLTDVCEHTNQGPFYTFPSTRPKIRLDYIFVSRQFQLVSVHMMNILPQASDHLPLLATVRFSG
ncbi:metal-dependent hydrolase [Collibacillus ludicampi]|uniref:Metal-dependent hydrolase n=1 Tax=Collibacillus ludicampi TaxID=2771369 RepID=A0AAV4LF36_9BACL|nr:endonuclease/exonuclease/phosphatase family protein [Collibacillus ludicampi]GIM46308.1 metal-dependent hydrolase [Collibacillus ludicampi]